jgi:hypothetical protein
MDFAAFNSSLGQEKPPTGLTSALEALWWDAKGDWAEAHRCAQRQGDPEGAWVHAYLHRVEGDMSNAGGWYRRAGKPVSSLPLKEEWEAIARAILG